MLTCNYSTLNEGKVGGIGQKLEDENFKAILGHTVSSWPAWDTKDSGFLKERKDKNLK